jgi:hypothetical protein
MYKNSLDDLLDDIEQNMGYEEKIDPVKRPEEPIKKKKKCANPSIGPENNSNNCLSLRFFY